MRRGPPGGGARGCPGPPPPPRPARPAPARPTIIDGARWSCEGSACTASGGTEQPATRACRRVVQKFGPVTAFSYKGKTLSAEELAACNA
ncbi:CC_3452 family protein [Brevundimonas aurantiaca]|uniref:CC_3452 family protein n=1 Tax=Brevundimonas aurantiaca TaxID=74316 RepID=UPI001F2E77F2|nr:hypothetical protein [Brevundimonas aurantiaca]